MNANKVVLLNAPLYSSADRRHFQPLGIASMAASLRENGYVCDVIDGDLPEYTSLEKIVECLLDYDLIGISATTPALSNAVLIAERVKQIKEIPIVLGGHCATFMHEAIIERYNCFDAIIRGEGESPVVALCDDFFSNGAFTIPFDFLTAKNINGMRHISQSIATEGNLDSLPFPIREQSKEYLGEQRNITISSSRGCPYGCSFCSATNFRNKWSGRSPENIAEEVYGIFQNLKDFNIIFVDDNFYIDPDRSIKILERIRKKCGRSFQFVFATRADQIINGKKYLRRLKDYGCMEIEMGVENGSDSVLQRYKKNISSSQNRLAIQMLQAQHITPVVDYVLFDPEITREELIDNVYFMKSAHLWGYDPPLVYERVVPFPGTEFTEMHPSLYRENCIISSKEYFVNTQALEVYKYMQLFRLRYQSKINFLMAAIRNQEGNEWSHPSCQDDLIWMKVLPYDLLVQLLTVKEDHRGVYDAFIAGKRVEVRLQEYKGRYIKDKDSSPEKP